jgi:hypothetical protein
VEFQKKSRGQTLICGATYENKAKGKGQKGYEIKRENRAAGSVWLHFALAARSADSGFAFVFSAARLHIEARGNAR